MSDFKSRFDVVSEKDEIPLEWNELWDAMRAVPHPWILTTEDMFYSMLEAVPPQDMGSGGFLVGEAQYHNAANEPVYACFAGLPNGSGGSLFQARYLTPREFSTWELIHKQNP